jgi:hypothetical protein
LLHFVPTIYPFACFLDCTDSHFVLLRVSLVNQQSLNAMKKVILVSLVVFGLATLGAQAQTNTATGNRGSNSSTGASNGATNNTGSNSGAGMSTTGGGMVSTGSADQDTARTTRARKNRRNEGSSMQGNMNRKERKMKKGDASMSSPMSTTSPR